MGSDSCDSLFLRTEKPNMGFSYTLSTYINVFQLRATVFFQSKTLATQHSEIREPDNNLIRLANLKIHSDGYHECETSKSESDRN